jgi:16S rRNA (uracil1498-N3)-methyltransferase
MRRRFFVEKFADRRAVMEGEAAHHLGRVLRAQPGQLYELSDGTSVWLGKIETVSRDQVNFELMEELAAFQPEIDTTLLLAVAKFDAFEWALEKATELGVNRIVPLAAERSEKGLLAAAVKRAERWEKIIREASQQSRRVRIPRLQGLVKPEVAFSSYQDGVRIMLSELPEARSFKAVLTGQASRSAVLAVGPEGGWTDKEFAAAWNSGFKDASLGKLILRTETAVVAGLCAMNLLLGSD